MSPRAVKTGMPRSGFPAHSSAVRRRGHPSAVRALRLAPMVMFTAWMLSVVNSHGSFAPGAGTNGIPFLLFVASLALALASGVYERPRVAADTGFRRSGGIDWGAFDRAREQWEWAQ